jgi:outer membrane protein OmpA-like peptidoglycan-associated protein
MSHELKQLKELESKLERLEFTSSDRSVLIDRLLSIFDETLIQTLQNKDSKTIEIFSQYISKIITKSSEADPAELSYALQQIISPAIAKEINDNKDKMIDALYPIMGGMISKYVTQSIKEMMEGINKKIEDGISLDRYKRKIKSKITGVSETEILLQESDQATISSIFIIEKESGMLIAEAQLGEMEIDDTHMVASMASAIKDFINDWIQNSSKTSEVQILSYGDATLYIESAGSVYIVAFLDSEPNFELRSDINDFFASIVKRYSSFFQTFDGDDSSDEVKQLSNEIDRYIQKQSISIEIDKKDTKNRPAKYIIWVLGILILGYFGQNLYRVFNEYSLEKEINRKTTQNIKIRYKNGFIYADGFIDSQDSIDKIKNIIGRYSNLPIKNQLIPSIESINSTIESRYSSSSKEIIQRMDKYINILEKKISDLTFSTDKNQKHTHNLRAKITNMESSLIALSKELKSQSASMEFKINNSQKILNNKIKELNKEIKKSHQKRKELKKILSIKASIKKELNQEFSNSIFYKSSDLSLDFAKLKLFTEGSNEYNHDKIAIFKENFEKYINILTKYNEYIDSIRIEGHTSSNGSYEYNLKLSKDRADHIYEYITRQFPKTTYNIIHKVDAYGIGSRDKVIKDGIEDKAASPRIKVRFKIKSDKMLENIEKILL